MIKKAIYYFLLTLSAGILITITLNFIFRAEFQKEYESEDLYNAIRKMCEDKRVHSITLDYNEKEGYLKNEAHIHFEKCQIPHGIGYSSKLKYNRLSVRMDNFSSYKFGVPLPLSVMTTRLDFLYQDEKLVGVERSITSPL